MTWLIDTLLALHWFNPLAWLGWRALRRDQEAACDARVLAGGDAQTRATYAALIASFAQSPRLALAAPMACPVLGEKSIIHRLRSLTMTPPSNRRRLLGRALLGTGLLALPLTASITYAAVDEDSELPAAPPAAPEAPAAPAAPEALASIPDVPDAPTAPGQKRVVIKRFDKGKAVNVDTHSLHGEDCDGTEISKVDVKGDDGEKPQHVHVAMCAKVAAKAAAHQAHAAQIGAEAARAEAMAHRGTAIKAALSGLRSARDELSRDKNLSDKIRAEVIKELDAEIARLSKEG